MNNEDIASIIRALGPEPYHFYEVEGRILYEIRSDKHTVTRDRICYLIQKGDKLELVYKYAIEFNNDMSLDEVESKFLKAKEDFARNLEIAKTNPKHGLADMDGGNLGREKDN